MKKIYSILSIAALGAASLSCEDDQFTNEGVAPFPTGPNVEVEVSKSTINFTEQADTVDVTVSIPETYVVDIPVNIAFAEGSTLSTDDVSFPPQVIITAGYTSTSFQVITSGDCDYEETETGTLVIGAGPEVNSSVTPATIDITLENYVQGGLDVDVNWARSTEYYDSETGEQYDPTDLADIDLYLIDEGFTTIIDGMGGSSYEYWENFGADVPDGTYLLAAQLYEVARLDPDGDEDIYGYSDSVDFYFPINATFSRCGSFLGSEADGQYVIKQSEEDALTDEDYKAYNVFAKVTKTNGVWTVTDVEDREIVKGAALNTLVVNKK